MPAKSEKQRKLFAMALAVRLGKMPKSKASKEVLDLESSKITTKELTKFASKVKDAWAPAVFDLPSKGDIIQILEQLGIQYKISEDEDGEFLSVYTETPGQTENLYNSLNAFTLKNKLKYSDYPELFDFLVSCKGEYIKDNLIYPIQAVDGKWNVIIDSELVPTDAEVVAEIGTQQEVVAFIKRLICEELIAWYQYWKVIPFVVGKERSSLQDKIKEFSNEELNDHAEKLMERLNQLGSDCTDFSSIESWYILAKNYTAVNYNSYNTVDVIRLNIEAEEGAIKSYTEFCNLAMGVDHVSYLMACDILSDEQKHLRELKDFMCDIS